MAAKSAKTAKIEKQSAKSASAAPKVSPWEGGLIHQVPGFKTVIMHCGLKSNAEKPDLAILRALAPKGSSPALAGVFTTNKVCAAPVRWSQAAMKKSKGHAQAVIVNAGNANACTGEQGEKDAKSMAELTADALGVKAEEIQVCSTGIIGHKLKMDKVSTGIGMLAKQLSEGKGDGDFARAIMTTDLVPKTAAVTLQLGGKTVNVAGACKGSGMIAPRMATTLGFVATDAVVTPAVLQKILSDVSDETFNCVTVDGDTSTNDTLLALASGQAGNPMVSKTSGADYDALREALYQVCDSMARQIAADGEGAQHTITLYVGGTKTDAQAKQIARAIAESPLVKTAIAGCDPNWGRIVAAAGRSGVNFDPSESSLTMCGFELFRDGMPTVFEAAKVSAALKNRDVGIVFMAGTGPGRAKFYTCDLTHGYIEINADYHT